jgi:hypothetical protein
VKIDRRFLAYASFLLVGFLVYKTIEAEQWVITAITVIVYISFIFGVDKFVVDLKNKKVEMQDADKN